MSAFGKPGPYGKFYTNLKETPVGNDQNIKEGIKREGTFLNLHKDCPSPWLYTPSPQHFKERTELPIIHPYGGGLRWHQKMRSFGPGLSLDKTSMFCYAGDDPGIFTITKPFRVGYGDSFGFSIDVEFDDDGGYVAFGICPPNWSYSRSLAHKGACCVRYDGAFSTADKAGGWDVSQCHPLVNIGGTVHAPPLSLSPAPFPSPFNKGKTPSPIRPSRVKGNPLQDGQMPAGGRGRVMISIAPLKNNLWVAGNDYEVKVPSCKIEMGSSAVFALEICKGTATICRAHDGSSLAEKLSNKGIKETINNDTRFVSRCLEGPKGFNTSPLNVSGVRSIERAL